MQLTPEQVEGIHLASVVHDVGKIRVPAEILSKPGKLSDNEFSLIKEHSQNGYEILKSIDFPWPIAQIVLQHHERLDGSGYPNGLSDGQILMEAKILAVADVVESMKSHRPYRPGLGIDVALGEILRHKGTLFDPKVVDVCTRLFREQDFSFQV
jgi:HD-GYP domain-containing protein (c-di-GMP phosphodiesterase class II)